MFKIFLGQVEILILFLVAACFLVLFCFFLFPVSPPPPPPLVLRDYEIHITILFLITN